MAPKSANKTTAIAPKTSEKINTFKIENIIYIPLHVIPETHKAAFKQAKKVAPI